MNDDEWDDWESEDAAQSTKNPVTKVSMPSVPTGCDELVNKLHNLLLSFQNDLADVEVFESINRQLSKIKFDQFMQYYNANSKLSQYTIETELKRMKFIVTYNEEQFITEDEIIGIYDRVPLADVWRIANQSIYADMLHGLQQVLFRPELCISVVSTESSFFIDIDNNTLRARSIFRVMTMTENQPDIISTNHRTSNGTLELSSVTGEITVDIKRKTITQRVFDPVLRMVFESDLRTAAESISRLQQDEKYANVSTQSKSFAENISDIRARLMEHRPAASATRESIKATVQVVKKASGSLFAGMLEGVVWGIGNIVGAKSDDNHDAIDFRSCQVDSNPIVLSKSSATGDSKRDGLMSDHHIVLESPGNNAAIAKASSSYEDDDDDDDDNWDWNDDEDAKPNPSEPGDSTHSNIIATETTSTKSLAPMQLGAKLAERVVYSFGTMIGANNTTSVASDSPIKLYRREIDDKPIVAASDIVYIERNLGESQRVEDSWPDSVEASDNDDGDDDDDDGDDDDDDMINEIGATATECGTVDTTGDVGNKLVVIESLPVDLLADTNTSCDNCNEFNGVTADAATADGATADADADATACAVTAVIDTYLQGLAVDDRIKTTTEMDCSSRLISELSVANLDTAEMAAPKEIDAQCHDDITVPATMQGGGDEKSQEIPDETICTNSTSSEPSAKSSIQNNLPQAIIDACDLAATTENTITLSEHVAPRPQDNIAISINATTNNTAAPIPTEAPPLKDENHSKMTKATRSQDDVQPVKLRTRGGKFAK